MDIEDFIKVEEDRILSDINPNDIQHLTELLIEFNREPDSTSDFHKFKTTFYRKRKFTRQYKIMHYRALYLKLLRDKVLEYSQKIVDATKVCQVRENSGVLVVTLLMSPYPEDENGVKQKFTCSNNCYFCPSDPDMPKSYIKEEPAVARGVQHGFDPFEQFTSRIKTYTINGMNTKNIKAEVILEGGTFNYYNKHYRMNFIRYIYYAANMIDCPESERREIGTLAEEQSKNENAICKIVGLSIETRPDWIDDEFILEMRECGVTRVQLGIQHTDDNILKRVNRGCTTNDAILAIRKLKWAGFKIAIHLMPDLPFSDPEKDKEMFDIVLSNPDLQFDYIKIYPTAVTKYTVIKKWYDSGKYFPYFEDVNGIENMMDVITHFKKKVHPWIRIERIIRDIPVKHKDKQIIFGGCNKSNFRQLIQQYMEKNNIQCHCIRCREIKGDINFEDIKLVIRSYTASGGLEYFISYETSDRSKIYGFCRLRLNIPCSSFGSLINNIDTHLVGTSHMDTILSLDYESESNETIDPNNNATIVLGTNESSSNIEPSNTEQKIEELINATIVRELHVYGKMTPVGNDSVQSSQHRGLGKKMLKVAKELSQRHGYNKMAVISAVGTRGYYRKQGFIDGTYYQHLLF